MDINFSCQKCGQHLVIDDAAAGMVVACPECGADVPVPSAPKATSDAKPAPPNERTVALKWTPPTRDDTRK